MAHAAVHRHSPVRFSFCSRRSEKLIDLLIVKDACAKHRLIHAQLIPVKTMVYVRPLPADINVNARFITPVHYVK